jgi:hypothetical protein
MAATMDIQLNIRSWDVELVEEDIRHIGIKMLPSMQYDLFHAIGLLDGAGDHAGFDELRACTYDCKYSLHCKSASQ